MAQLPIFDKLVYDTLMASSEVDQKFLGQFAKSMSLADPILSSHLYKVLGLSVILSKKLLRARRLRKLDTTRDTKSLQLYYQIIWLTREGLSIIQYETIHRVGKYVELKVLVYKLRASFYHIFVLFHNQPSIYQTAIPSYSPTINKGKAVDRGSIRASPNPFDNNPSQIPNSAPPGLAPVSIPQPSASFLVRATDWRPLASSTFIEAANLSDTLLSGSHPIRLSVKTEYAAYLYDCLHDGEGSRRLAQQTIRDVYNAPEGMDDEMFEDAAEMVGILAKMMKRGLGGSGTSGSTSRVGSAGTPSTPRARGNGTPRAGDEGVPKMPSPRMQNRI